MTQQYVWVCIKVFVSKIYMLYINKQTSYFIKLIKSKWNTIEIILE